MFRLPKLCVCSRYSSMEIDDKFAKKLFIVPVTAIVVRDGKFLIVKRADYEKAFPGKWTVPGGKFEEDDFISRPPTTKSHDSWYGVLEHAIEREVMDEANVEVRDLRYLTNYTFKHPKGFWVLGLSFWSRYKSGYAKPGRDLVDHAWVTLEEAKSYDLIEGIYEELADVAKLI